MTPFFVLAYIVKNPSEMDKSLHCAFNNLYKKCSVLVCVIPYDAYYSPTIPLHGNFSQMIYHKFDENSPVNKCRYEKI